MTSGYLRIVRTFNSRWPSLPSLEDICLLWGSTGKVNFFSLATYCKPMQIQTRTQTYFDDTANLLCQCFDN